MAREKEDLEKLYKCNACDTEKTMLAFSAVCCKQLLQQERQQKKNRDNNKFYRELTMKWYDHARAEENSAQEKFVLFLHDIFVIDQRKVQDAPNLYSFQNALREGVFLNYPQLIGQESELSLLIIMNVLLA